MLGGLIAAGLHEVTESYDYAIMFAAVLYVAAATIWFVLPKYRYAKNIGEMPAA
jgi:hypothetical protein